MEIHNMSDTDEQGPRGMARAVCGTAGGAATLVRLSAGIAAVACLCWFVKDLVRIREKKKKGKGWEALETHSILKPRQMTFLMRC